MGYDIEKEKREAIEAGRRALNSLNAAKENLNSAKNWGLVDMFGGGFFSTMLKHSKMDQAKQNMEQAKYDLRNFSRELNDVNMACNLHIDTAYVKRRAMNQKWFIALRALWIISAFLFPHSAVQYSMPVRWRSYQSRDSVNLLPEKFHPVFC